MKQVQSMLRDYEAFSFFALTGIMFLPVYFHLPLALMVIFYLFYEQRKSLVDMITAQPVLMIGLIYAMLNALINQNYLGTIVPVGYLILYLLSHIYLKWITPYRYEKLMALVMIGSGAVAVLSLIKYLSYSLQHGYGIFYIFKYSNIQTRAEGTFFNANYYGLFCLFAVAVGLYLLKKETTILRPRLLYLLIGLNLIAIVLTASRIVLPLVIFVFVVFYSMLQPKRLIPLGGVLCLSILLLIAFPNIFPRFTSLVYAFEDRFSIWHVGWEIFMRNPLFGYGPMSYSHLFHLYTDKADIHSHQLYINLLANYGIIGMVLLLYIAKNMIRRFFKALRTERTPEAALFVTIVMVILTHGLVDVAILWTQSFYFALIITIPLIYQKI